MESPILVGLLLVASPCFLPFPDNPIKGIALTSGVVLLAYSIMTDYPLALLEESKAK